MLNYYEINKPLISYHRHNEEIKLFKQTQNEFEEYKKRIDELSKQLENDEKEVSKNRFETGSELYQMYNEKKNTLSQEVNNRYDEQIRQIEEERTKELKVINDDYEKNKNEIISIIANCKFENILDFD